MNDQSQMMKQHQVINYSQSNKLNLSQQLMNQPQILNRFQMLNSQMVSQPPMVSQMNPPQMMNPMMTQSFPNWPQQQPPNMPPIMTPNMPPMSSLKFPNQMNQMYGAPNPGRSNWKGKKVIDNKRKDVHRKEMVLTGPGTSGAVGGSYKPPTLNELEHQNRLKARRFFHKKKFNRMGAYAHAPRNTTSYLIRAKKEGGIASLVSPCPVTPAVLPTPVFSPSREALVDMAKEEWGVDGYGSMKGLIRLRSSPGHEADMDDYEDEDDGGSSESDVEEHLEVERRLDHDLSRFEMIYPNYGTEYNNVLENRVDDQDTQIAHLEEENLLLKERLYLMERELGEIKRRMQFLERQNQVVEDINEEVVENVSETGSEGTRDTHLMEDKHNEVDYVQSEGTEHGGDNKLGNVVEALNSEQVTAIAKEKCEDRSLENQGPQTDWIVDTKDATLLDDNDYLEMGTIKAVADFVDFKGNSDDYMDFKGNCAVQKVEASESMVGKGIDDTKEAALLIEKDDLELVKSKDETHDMDRKVDCDVQKAEASKSLVGNVISESAEMDVGKSLAETDDAGNTEPVEDLHMKDSAPNNAPEDGLSEQ